MKAREELLREIQLTYNKYCDLLNEYHRLYPNFLLQVDETTITAEDFLGNFYI